MSDRSHVDEALNEWRRETRRRPSEPHDKAIHDDSPLLEEPPWAYEPPGELIHVANGRAAAASPAFAPDGPNKFRCDLYGLARWRLQRVGVNAVYGGEYCTVKDADLFFSYRRDGVTGRMASLIWLD